MQCLKIKNSPHPVLAYCETIAWIPEKSNNWKAKPTEISHVVQDSSHSQRTEVYCRSLWIRIIYLNISAQETL